MSDEQGDSRRRGPRFSLAALLVAIAIAALAVGYYAAADRARDLERELRQRRIESGELVVVDPARVNVIAVPADEPNTWRWRVHFPAGRRYAWNIGTGKIRRNGMPVESAMMFASNEEAPAFPVETLVTAKLREQGDGTWLFLVRARGGLSSEQDAEVSRVVPAEVMEWFSTCTDRHILGDRGVELAGPAPPIRLFTLRACQQQPDGKYRAASGPAPGLSVWLD